MALHQIVLIFFKSQMIVLGWLLEKKEKQLKILLKDPEPLKYKLQQLTHQDPNVEIFLLRVIHKLSKE
jgi:hypothetical protein